MDDLAQSLQQNYDLGTTASYIIGAIVIVLIYAALLVICYFLWKLIQKVNHKIFQKLEEKKGRTVTLEFMEKLVSFGITFFFLIIVPFNWDDIGNSVFGSAAVLTAVIGFAGQDVIKDILAGIQISIYKPQIVGFPVSDQQILQNGGRKRICARPCNDNLSHANKASFSNKPG